MLRTLPEKIVSFLNAIIVGLREILANKFRSLLTMLGIVLGVSSLVAMAAIVKGMENGMKEAMIALGGLDKADGSLRRPDIAIFCTDQLEQDEAVTIVPEAVVEIVSAGYEAKDLELGPMFYLAQGVKDVIVFEPRTEVVIHSRRTGMSRSASPTTITLECGCSVTI